MPASPSTNRARNRRAGTALSRLAIVAAVVAMWPATAAATTVTVPATVQWTDTGIDVQAGMPVTITASGQWQDRSVVSGPDGRATPGADNFFNLADLGVCNYCATTPAPHYNALIGYIGSAPPPPGSYTSANVLEEARKIFVVGSRYAPTSGIASTGRLWLNFNADAYSAYTIDNAGSVVADVTVTPAATPPSTQRTGAAYVALGDSYSAGEGAGDYESSGRSTDNCHRSANAYPHLIANGIRSLLPDLSFVACTGAITYDLGHAAERWDGGPPAQLDDASLGDATKVVTLTIGGNDANFPGIAFFCLQANLGGDKLKVALGGRTGCSRAISAAAPLLGALGGTGSATVSCAPLPWPVCSPQARPITALREVVKAILSRAPNAHVFIGGYPTPFGHTGEDCPVGSILTVTKANVALANEFAEELNDRIRATDEVNRARVTYVDVSKAFGDHRLCDKKTQWINSVTLEGPRLGVAFNLVRIGTPPLVLELKTDHVYASSLHPSRDGQCAYAEAFGQIIARVFGERFHSTGCGDAGTPQPLTVPSEVYVDRSKGTLLVPFHTLGPARGMVYVYSHRARRRITLHPGWNQVVVRVGHRFRLGRHRLLVKFRQAGRRRTYRRTIVVRAVPHRRPAASGRTTPGELMLRRGCGPPAWPAAGSSPPPHARTGPPAAPRPAAERSVRQVCRGWRRRDGRGGTRHFSLSLRIPGRAAATSSSSPASAASK